METSGKVQTAQVTPVKSLHADLQPSLHQTLTPFDKDNNHLKQLHWLYCKAEQFYCVYTFSNTIYCTSIRLYGNSTVDETTKNIPYSSGKIVVVPNKGKAHFCAVSFTGGQHYQSPCQSKTTAKNLSLFFSFHHFSCGENASRGSSTFLSASFNRRWQ